jgi:hypothetical protein
MERKMCVFKPDTDFKTGDQIFWYDHAETGDKEFDDSFIRIYNDKSIENPFLRCHICNITEVSEDMTERKWGGLYLKSEFSQIKADKP